MKPEKIFSLAIIIVVALFVINFSIKIFNTFDAWLGIGLGALSITLLLYLLIKIIIKKINE